MTRSFPNIAALATLLLVSACTVGPDYKAPQLDLPSSWQDEGSAPPDPAALAAWWSQLDDPTLDALIATAERDNLDLKMALARLDAYRAALGIASGERLPQVGATASAGRQGTSENSFNQGVTTNTFELGASLSWEVDLFGRLRRSVEAARADLEANSEMVTDLKTSLYANVAASYFEIRTLQERLRVLEDNLNTQEEGLKLAEARLKHGLGSQLEVAQARSLLEANRAQRPALKAALAQVQGALTVLLGQTPQELQLDDAGILPEVPPRIALGVPADLLRQRADIRQAERMLAAQIARVGVAEAERYPNFSLTAVLGQQAFEAGDLFDSASTFWGLGASLTQSIFNGSRLRNRVRMEDARAREALHNYEQTVLRALEEVHTGARVYQQQQQQLVHLDKALDAARKSLDAARNLYKEGLVDFQNVLDAQRQQLAIEDQRVAVRGTHAVALTSLYRALGGGWDPSQRNL